MPSDRSVPRTAATWGAADGNDRIRRRERHAPCEGGADGVDESGRELREVGEGSPADALSLAQQDGGGEERLGMMSMLRATGPGPCMATKIQ